MNPVPLIPDTAPFTPEQRAWLNGFFAGVFSRATSGSQLSTLLPGDGQDKHRAGSSQQQCNSQQASPALQPLTILFGSQTGSAEGLAKKAAKEAGRRGFAATVLDMAQTGLARLASEKHLLVITSTYGDGEPPDNAKALHAALRGASQLSTLLPRPEVRGQIPGTAAAGQPDNPQLSTLRYSVCALGDTNYVHFCQCGKDLDAWLEKLGATRVSARVDCDLDYEGPFTMWLDAALSVLSEVGRVAPNAPSSANSIAPATEEPPAYSKKNPFPAPVLASRCLNAPGSAKAVTHVEFSLEGSGLAYEAGDALGVVPQNCPELVADVLAALGCDGEEAVTAPAGHSLSLRRALTECYDLGRPGAELLALVSPVGASLPVRPAPGPEPVEGLATPYSQLSALLPGDGQDQHRAGSSQQQCSSQPPFEPHHVIDVLLAGSPRPSATAFVAALKRLQPRLYSIASSPKAHPGQIHLTVGTVRYEKDGRARKGVCSAFLAERALAAGQAGVFVHTNQAFRPPADSATPMIMVGPGTGIAPFRAFLEERAATGAPGKNWLFFGDQHAATDFLYRDELFALRAAGVLTRLDLAFSRDQPEKIYVQHRMLEHAGELYSWLEQGAHFYVCGDATRMAKDVDGALHRVIESAGGKSPEAAAAYVQALKTAKRYARDVY